MKKTSVELTGTFLVIDDAGARHVINVYTEFQLHTMLDGTTARSAGQQSLRMAASGNEVAESDTGVLIEKRTQRKMRRL